MRRIGRALAKLFFTTMLGFAVGAIVPMPILLSSLVGLTGARFIDRRRRLLAFRRAVLSRYGEWRRAA